MVYEYSYLIIYILWVDQNRKKEEKEEKEESTKPQKKNRFTQNKTTKMNFIDKNKKPANTGGIDETVKLAAGKLDGLAGMHEYGDRQKDYTWDCVIFGDGS
jgi:hypothetical protein